MKKTIATRIKELRETRGMTQAQLGDKLSVTDKTISKWEKGKSEPDSESLVRIAALFNVTLDYLLTGATKAVAVQSVSKIELACKDDNIAMLNGVDLKVPDETGKDVAYYAKEYNATKILRYLEELAYQAFVSGAPVKTNKQYLIVALSKGTGEEGEYVLLGKDYDREEITAACANAEKEGFHGFKVFSLAQENPAEIDYSHFSIDCLDSLGFRAVRLQIDTLDDLASGILTAEFYTDAPHEEKRTDANGKETVKKYRGYRDTYDSYIPPKALKEFHESLLALDFDRWEDKPWGIPLCHATYLLKGDVATYRFRHYSDPGMTASKAFARTLLRLCMASMDGMAFKRLTRYVSAAYIPYYREGLPIKQSRVVFCKMEKEGFRLSLQEAWNREEEK